MMTAKEALEELEDDSTLWDVEELLREALETVHRLHGGIEVDPSLCQHPECWRLWH